MTATTASALAPVRPTYRQVGIVAVGSLVIGGIETAGQMLYRAKPWWAILVESAVPLVAQGVFLLIALTAALKWPIRGVPRWASLVLAGVAATLLTATLDGAASYAIRTALWMSDDFSQDFRARWWTASASLSVVALLGVLIATRAADTAQSRATLQRLQLDHARVARQAFEERLAALQARIEPKFLFETLRDIERCYEADPAGGARMLDWLIAYLRAALPRTESAPTSLRAEIELARAWLEIVRLRSEGRVSFAVAVADDLMTARVPPMLLAPLVSQAVAGGHDEERAVLVAAERLDDTLAIIVTGRADSFSPTQPPAAAQAIETRLATIYGTRARIRLRRARDRSQAIREIPYEPTDRPAR